MTDMMINNQENQEYFLKLHFSQSEYRRVSCAKSAFGSHFTEESDAPQNLRIIALEVVDHLFSLPLPRSPGSSLHTEVCLFVFFSF